MTDAIFDVEKCAQAIERALTSMKPPLEVYEGILKLFVEFEKPYGACRLHWAADASP